ncbi:MAG: hypothetical protein NTZ63_02370 [Candidatus Omnitrophica bacterium]|nr:hypothetical protein [Candidatus Omnitrophota bacterium]
MGDKYEMEYGIEIVEAIGAEVRDKKIDLFVNSLEARKIDQILEQEGLAKSDTLVGIHPGGAISKPALDIREGC